MSDSISVRVTCDSYDTASAGRQTQVYVQIPEVARTSWLLASDLFDRLKDRAWPEVLDVVHDYVTYGGAASNSSATAAWAAVREWLRDAANRDEMQAAFEEHEARRHPVARKLLEENGRLRAEVAALRDERHTTNEALDDVVQTLREPLKVFRAAHDSIVMGLYTTREAAQAHCEAKVQQEEPAGSIRHLSWSADDIGPDAEYELHITPAETGGLIRGTGYVVSPLDVSASYDEEADE